MSLRPGDRSPDHGGEFAGEHQCAFWNAQPAG